MNETDTVAGLTERINELEVERDKAQRDFEAVRAALLEANQTTAELRARLFSIGLLLRP